MNVYRLQYRERGYTTPLDSYNILAEDLDAALVVGNKHAKKANPGMVTECSGADEIATNVITNGGSQSSKKSRK